jgi:hypothetical protein
MSGFVRFPRREPERRPPLYLARIEDLGRSDFVKVGCAACHHVALLLPVVLLKLGLSLSRQRAGPQAAR